VKRGRRVLSVLPGTLSAQTPRRKIPVFVRNTSLLLEIHQKIAIKPYLFTPFLGEKK
jgi:hypothetical protein